MRIVSHSFWPVLVYLSWATVAVGADRERPGDAARTMVEAEKNFYQAGQERGTRAAFLAFLADDGVVFRPGPVNGKKVWTERPETGLDLIWEPTFASMARSADFGFTSGPAQMEGEERRRETARLRTVRFGLEKAERWFVEGGTRCWDGKSSTA